MNFDIHLWQVLKSSLGRQKDFEILPFSLGGLEKPCEYCTTVLFYLILVEKVGKKVTHIMLLNFLVSWALAVVFDFLWSALHY